mmetsp:Transcript_104598/g.180268  ORF Transcript_104598/g.180268 Transcript_104598/m.180268 type:complete len:197 (-) Transcript_104598:31-621(-)
MEAKAEKVASAEEVRATALCMWYPIFQRHTFKTVLIDLSSEFMEYLQQDGMVIPASANTLKRAADEDYGALTDDWDDYADDDDPEQPCPEFPEIQQQIKDCLRDFEEILPRSNWSTPKDATWLLPSHTLKCVCVEDVFLLVKGSSRLSYDYSDWHALQVVPPVLVLRKWYGLVPSLEFRGFVVDGQLVGISQRHCK